MDLFLAEDVLSNISYTSQFKQSLKTISLRKTPLQDILDDIEIYRNEFALKLVVQDNIIGSRFKSEDSIMRKYAKTLRTGGGFKQCFNDVLGFRLHFNIWSHKWVYKYMNPTIGRLLYDYYIHGDIKTEDDFISKLSILRK